MTEAMQTEIMLNAREALQQATRLAITLLGENSPNIHDVVHDSFVACLNNPKAAKERESGEKEFNKSILLATVRTIVEQVLRRSFVESKFWGGDFTEKIADKRPSALETILNLSIAEILEWNGLTPDERRFLESIAEGIVDPEQYPDGLLEKLKGQFS